MKTDNRHIIASQWSDVHAKVLASFENAPLRGVYGICFTEDEALGDFHRVEIFFEEDSLKATAFTWSRLEDYKRWQYEVGIVPVITSLDATLPDEEKKHFEKYFEELLKAPEAELLGQPAWLVLDGCSYHLKLYRKGQVLRSLTWKDSTETCGPLAQLMHLSSWARKKE